MTPDRFIQSLKRQGPAPAYLFLGSEAHQRARAKKALLETVLPPEERDCGLAGYDLSECSLAEIIDDARSLSLFSARRLIVARNAEGALPHQKSDEAGEEETAAVSDAAPLTRYLQDPSPGVVLLFEATRFGFEGDEKKKLDRVRKFYASVTETVELRRYSTEEAWAETQALARAAGLTMQPAALSLIVESLGAEVSHIAREIEKLSLYAGSGRAVTVDDIMMLVPDARSATIFELVNALGRRDRSRALGILDTLTREGEYLPLALAFLATQFRLALAARQAGLRSSFQVQANFSKMGVAMWGARAEQILQTSLKFSPDQLQKGLTLIFEADRDLRSARPDDRIIMERFVLRLTQSGDRIVGF
jgi:DNA polymerase III subunit delta